jgi:V-type H+-transporting ATPase subunit a
MEEKIYQIRQSTEVDGP